MIAQRKGHERDGHKRRVSTLQELTVVKCRRGDVEDLIFKNRNKKGNLDQASSSSATVCGQQLVQMGQRAIAQWYRLSGTRGAGREFSIVLGRGVNHRYDCRSILFAEFDMPLNGIYQLFRPPSIFTTCQGKTRTLLVVSMLNPLSLGKKRLSRRMI